MHIIYIPRLSNNRISKSFILPFSLNIWDTLFKKEDLIMPFFEIKDMQT